MTSKKSISSKVNLIIVESPTKAKTISRFVGKNYIVKSSYGHIRDLPKSKLGVDTENNFEPEYAIPAKAQKNLSDLKKFAAKSDKIILATDEDREGEAISWHLAQVLGLGKYEIRNTKYEINPNQIPIPSTRDKTPNKSKKIKKAENQKPYERIVFHEITKTAIENALANPRQIDMNLVNAQQARRVLDRLVGYELSPLLWKKIRYGLSAGRVQSVAVRLIAEREEEINKFKSENYWTITTKLKTKNKEVFDANLNEKNGEKIEQVVTLKLFAGNYKTKKTVIDSRGEADEIAADLEKAQYKISSISEKEILRYPSAPFTTSTLQQSAIGNLGFSAKYAMSIAQKLYEQGYITYMRTDSVNLSLESTLAAKKTVAKLFGGDYALDNPRFYKTKSKNAQEAHEAIRPTFPGQTPEDLKNKLEPNEYKLYNLIWERMVASQMQPAIFNSVRVEIVAKGKNNYILQANGSTLEFDGYLKAHGGKINGENILPKMKAGEALGLIKVISTQKQTAPPPRYSEATLVKILEEYGIGRPSTYAPTISTIQDRGYVEKIDKRFHPQEIGILVNKLLAEHFPQIVDIKFTAKMEKDLDEIAENKKEWVPIIKDFYGPFKENLAKKEKEINKKDLIEQKTDKKCPKCGAPMIIKLGRFGKFLACSNYPECKTTEPMGEEKKMHEEFSNELCEKCGKPMAVKMGRFGVFLGCSDYPNCKNIKKITRTTGVKCPKCLASPDLAKRDKPGEIVEKMSKRKKVFYGCDQYPKCDYAAWKKPRQEQ